MIGVDRPKDVYLASKIMRQKDQPQAVPYTPADLLNALYIGSGALGSDPMYHPMWTAIEDVITKLERELEGGKSLSETT